MDGISSVNKITDQGDVKKKLARIIRGKVIILGVGNDLRGDDGVGSLLAKGLKGMVKGIVYDGGVSPENYIGKIIKEKPDIILIVDALDMGGEPGKVAIFEPEQLGRDEFSTHHLSLPLLAEIIGSQIRTQIYTIGVQPERTKFGEGLSPSVGRTLEGLKQVLAELLA